MLPYLGSVEAPARGPGARWAGPVDELVGLEGDDVGVAARQEGPPRRCRHVGGHDAGEGADGGPDPRQGLGQHGEAREPLGGVGVEEGHVSELWVRPGGGVEADHGYTRSRLGFRLTGVGGD